MSKQIKLEEVLFDYEYDTETVWLNANYRNILKARLSFRRPGAGYDMMLLFEFIKTEEFEYIKNKLLKVIQMDLDRLNA